VPAAASAAVPTGSFRFLPLLLALVVFLPRLAFLLATRQADPFFSELVMDEKVHWGWAGEILRSGTLEGAFFRPPLACYLLALFRFLTNDSIFLCRLLFSLTGVGVALVVFRIARRIAPLWLAFVVALLPTLAVESLYDDTRLLTDSLASLLMVGALAVALERPSRPLVFGLLAGLAELTRGVALLLFPVWLFVELMRAREGEGIRRELGGIGRRFALAVALFLVCLVPTAVINAWKAKDFLPVAWNTGLNLHIGNNPKSDGMTAIETSFRKDWWGSYYDFIREAEEKSGRKLRPSEVNAYWYRRALSFWRDEPAAAARLMLRKGRYFVSGAEIPNNIPESPAIATGGALFAHWPLRIRWLLPFLPVGLALLFLRRAPPEARGAALLALLYSALIVVVFVTSRYRIPVYPPLAVVAAAAIALFLPGSSPSSKGSKVIVPIAFAVGLLALGSFSLPPNAAAFDVAVGNVRLQQKRFDEAEGSFRKAETESPGFPQVAEGLAMIAELRGSPAEALPLYRRELELHDSVYSRYRIAAILYDEKQYAEGARILAPTAGRFEDTAILQAKLLVALERRGEAAELLRGNLAKGWAKDDSEYLLALVAVLDGDPAAAAAIEPHRGEERWDRLAGLLESRSQRAGTKR
jgi:tetratricopeptide (TPR) repeat protein